MITTLVALLADLATFIGYLRQEQNGEASASILRRLIRLQLALTESADSGQQLTTYVRVLLLEEDMLGRLIAARQLERAANTHAQITNRLVTSVAALNHTLRMLDKNDAAPYWENVARAAGQQALLGQLLQSVTPGRYEVAVPSRSPIGQNVARPLLPEITLLLPRDGEPDPARLYETVVIDPNRTDALVEWLSICERFAKRPNLRQIAEASHKVHEIIHDHWNGGEMAAALVYVEKEPLDSHVVDDDP